MQQTAARLAAIAIFTLSSPLAHAALAAVPEASTCAMLFSGLVVLVVYRRARKFV